MNYQYKHLVGAMIVAGWDEQEGGQVRSCWPADTAHHLLLVLCCALLAAVQQRLL